MAAPGPHDSATQASASLLFGREREQALLRDWLRTALGGRGRLALISGEAGIGKSALAAWLAAEARERGASVWVGLCDDLAQTPPYGPWRDALARSGGNASSLQLLSPTGPNRASISSQPTLFDQFEAALAAAVAERPLVIVLEDLHWSDPASLELLRSLARGVDALRLLLVATYRGEELAPRQPFFEILPPLARDPHVERIDLGPLTATAVQAWLRARYALSPPDEARLVAFLQERAGGNPFYLTESLRALETDRLLLATESGWMLGDLGRASLPPLVRQIIERRLARLDAETLRLLEVAAVIGQEPPLDLWVAVSGAAHERLLVAADRAAAAGLALETATPARLVFAHALVRDTLYHRQPLSQRRATHQRLAETLAARHDAPVNLVASHFAAAGDPRAVNWLVRAGEQALDLYAARDAIAALTRAQEMASHLSRALPPAAYRARATAAMLLGAFDAARRDLEVALDLSRASDDRHAEWQALVDLGMLWAERDYDRTIGYYRAALALARETGDEQTIAYSLNRIANWHVNRDEPDVALPLHEEALALFRARDDRAGIADTLDFLGVAAFLNADFRHAAAYSEEAIALFRELDDRQRLSSSLIVLALSGGELDWIAAPSFRESASWIRAGEEAVAVARQIEWSAGEAFALICLGGVLATHGLLGRGLREAAAGLAIAERIGHEQWTIAGRQGLALVWGELLHPERALPLLEAALAAARASRASVWINTVVATMIPLLVAVGEQDRAAALLGTVPPASSSHRSVSQRQVEFARAELALARQQSVRALAIVDALIATRPHPMPDDALPQLMKLRGDALARLERTVEAETAYTAARDGARLLDYRPLLWRIDHARASLFASHGRTAEAEAAFLSACAAIDDLAATVDDPALQAAFRARARDRVRLGVSAGPGARRGDQLSPREREVLRYLVEGRSDREIAAALSISPRTVMRHVSSILDKLGVSSRTAAATFAVRKGLV